MSEDIEEEELDEAWHLIAIEYVPTKGLSEDEEENDDSEWTNPSRQKL
jgi:hypothetical protein